MHTRLTITGMTCSHCHHAVENPLEGVPGVADAAVDLARGAAHVAETATFEALAAATEVAGSLALPGDA